MGNKMLEEFYEHLDRLDKTRKKYAIWGAGAMGKSALSYINQHNSKLKHEFFVDNNPALWGKNGVISPKDFFDGKMSDIDTVFICVYVADEVEEQLRKNGFVGNTVLVIPSVFYREYYQNSYKGCEEHISKLKSILADDLSVKTVDAFFYVMETGDVSFWDGINGNSFNKTLEPDILKFSLKERFVDIGAFTGDTVERFLDLTNGKYEKIVCMEPDPDNYRLLRKYLSSLLGTLALQIASGENSGTACFKSGMSEGGAISNSGNVTVEVKCLDEIIEIQDASLVKISTIGNELSTLKGAKNLILKNKPKLSYYCSEHQIWEIPMYLKSLVPEYKFYIRHYGVGLQAMMGYAVL